MRRAVLLYNPASGRRRSPWAVPAIRSALTADDWRVDLLPTEGPGTAPNQLRRAVAAGSPDAVFVYGGDGTLREAAQGLLGTGIPFAPLPGGTTNVICHSLGLPRDPVAAAELLSRSRSREIAVGRLDDRIFLMQLSAGLDAAVLAAVDGEAKARWGRTAVLAAALSLFWRYPFLPIEARWEEGRASGSFVAVANIPHYAGPFRLARISPEERTLELVVHRDSGRWTTLLFALDLLRGRLSRRQDLLRVPVTRVTIEAPEGTPFQIDGDPCSVETPVTVRVGDELLPALLPPSRWRASPSTSTVSNLTPG